MRTELESPTSSSADSRNVFTALMAIVTCKYTGGRFAPVWLMPSLNAFYMWTVCAAILGVMVGVECLPFEVITSTDYSQAKLADADLKKQLNVRGTRTEWLLGTSHLPAFWRWRLTNRTFEHFLAVGYKFAISCVLVLASILPFSRQCADR